MTEENFTAVKHNVLNDSFKEFQVKVQLLEQSAKKLSQQYNAREEENQATTTELQNVRADILTKATEEASIIVAKAANIAEKIMAEKAVWEEEKEKMAQTHTFKSKIMLDVGGTKFSTSLATLQRFSGTMLGVMFSGRHALEQDERGYYFIDQDGTHFGEILNFLRKPEGFKVELPEAELYKMKRECEYYGLLELMFPLEMLLSAHTLTESELVQARDVMVRVTGAGVPEVNGDYTFRDVRNNAGFYVLSANYHGHEVVFTLYKCTLKTGGFQWFISITPPGKKPGTLEDIDFYYAKAKAHERLPPFAWIKMNPDPQQHSRDPPPAITYIYL